MQLIHIIFLVPSLPLDFTLASVHCSPTQLSASWSAPIPKNGIITGYSVYCNTSANQSYPEQVINSPIIISVVNGTTLAVTLTKLNPYTQYSCYVTANTSVGEGSPSTIETTQSGTNCLYYLKLVICFTIAVNTCSCDLNSSSGGCGIYSWPEAAIGQTISQMCQYGVVGQNITRLCNGDLTWTEDASQCPTVVTYQFRQLNAPIQNVAATQPLCYAVNAPLILLSFIYA